jgi:2-dehydro-3-deoxyphosphogluconate aldolase / (4S)-4-hydroxy-2-oxoglutarate aldolase
MTTAVRTDPPALTHLLRSGVVAVVRSNDSAGLVDAARAVAAGGVGSFEITMTTPGALDTVRTIADAGIHDLIVGAGTVLDVETAEAVIDAGGQFVVSPTVEPDVIRLCVERNVLCVPGAMTPTEALTAWRLGGSLIKVYPAPSVGTEFFKNVLMPLPFLKLLPSGSMTLELVPEWIRAGASAISVTSALLDPALIARAAWDQLTMRAGQFVGAVANARQERAS